MSSDTDSRWTITPAALERLVGNEREFREDVLVKLAVIGEKLDSFQNSLESHVKQDEDRFGKVTLTMGESTGKVHWILGGIAVGGFLLMALIGVARLFS